MKAPWPWRAWALLAAVLSLLSGGEATAGFRRGVLARPLPSKQCLNTVAGRWLSADDQGMVCRLEDVDSQSGCCKAGEKHSCNTCLEEDQCCVEYEHCVSCCMRGDHTQQRHLDTEFRTDKRQETGRWSSIFELCRGKCRTTKHATVHENSYLGRRHHCFGERPKPLLEPQRPSLPPGVTAVAAESPNLNCHQACASKQKTCAADKFDAVNSCDWLRDHFGCEAGCEIDTGPNRPAGLDHPAYVIYQSGKDAYPTMCFVNHQSKFDCAARNAKTRRLCPCA